LLETVDEDVSATELRERLERGDSCSDLLSPSVRAYIEAHRLYR
jgi:nicotinate-nucleotide adenylyltransferase